MSVELQRGHEVVFLAGNIDAGSDEVKHADEEKALDGTATTAAKKKKRNKKALAPAINELGQMENPLLRKLQPWPAVKESRQTFPPTIPVDKCFSKGNFPVGELMQHPGGNGVERFTSAEIKARERDETVNYDAIRRAAEAHRQTRKYVQEFLKPGITMLDLAQKLEAKSKELINANGLESGWAFPTGVSINHCAAHYTPNYGETDVVLKYDDIMKIDFGIHVGGRLVDCAFTVAFNDKYDNLIQATLDGTNTGLKEAGIDARFSEIGAAIEEAISSYEMEINGKMKEINPIENLNGHTTDVYRVHGGKSVPIVATDSDDIMEEGEVYAIETFASTGRGKVWEEGVCSHYMPEYSMWTNPKIKAATPAARVLQSTINENFGTLAFCRRWLDDAGAKRHLLSLKALVDQGLLGAYPPLCDDKGSFTSQMEHTVILRPTCKEVVSRGPDY